MIIIGVGSNLTSEIFRSKQEACETSIELLKENNIEIISKSSWYETAPIPSSLQPNFINGLISVNTQLNSLNLLKLLLRIELQMGRVRTGKNAARIIDLDLIAFNKEKIETKTLTLPHPKLTQRAFVVIPLIEIAPKWRHPVTGTKIIEFRKMVSDQRIRKLSE